ncbi:MAG: thiamine-phosphate kinase [Solirubrobacterales bacterium]
MDEGFTEFEVIDLLRSRSGSSDRLEVGIGDDAAVTVPGGSTATSVDAIVDGVHFHRDWSPPEAIAHRAVATALSDLAAMAAAPGEVYVTLGLPPHTDAGFLTSLADGFIAATEVFGAVLAGGDTVGSPVLFAAVTVVGHASGPGGFVLRSGASVDEVVAVTGELGGATAGLWLLANGSPGIEGLDGPTSKALIGRQLRPRPQLDSGLALARHGATAMVDVSDGLVQDLGHVAAASGVSLEIDARLVPVQPGVAAVEAGSGSSPGDMSLAGGEDYELALTIPEPALEAARQELETLGVRLTAIGRVAAGSGVRVVDEGGTRDSPAGFDHLA